jgi:hypothetical protein
MWLISGRTPYWPSAPNSTWIQFTNVSGYLIDYVGSVTTDKYVVNTIFSANPPINPAKMATPEQLLPSQNYTTIGDLLSASNVSWSWYAGGWDLANSGMFLKANNLTFWRIRLARRRKVFLQLSPSTLCIL